MVGNPVGNSQEPGALPQVIFSLCFTEMSFSALCFQREQLLRYSASANGNSQVACERINQELTDLC